MNNRHAVHYCILFIVSLLTAINITAFQRVSTAYGQVPHLVHHKTTAPIAHLLIPRINVDAPVEPVETNADGSMAVPHINEWTGVGLYADGPYPGELGSAVIDGHLDRPGGFPAVFWNLRMLHPGDIVKVETPGLPTVQFRVTQVAAYKPAVAPLSTIFDNLQGHFLNLITCSGRWIPAIHQTTQRLVVYTTMVTSPHV